VNVLIVGANGGIGMAIIRHLLTQIPQATIYATYRSKRPALTQDNLEWHQVNASKDSDIAYLASLMPQLDLLINAAGFLHDGASRPEKSVSDFDSDFFNKNLNSNTLPTLLLAKYFSTHLESKKTTYFVALSARIGSIDDNKLGGWVSYRCSKAALNMAIKTISIEWKRKLPNCCIFAFHPGTTDTKLSQPFQKNIPTEQMQSADDVSESLFKIIHRALPSDTGKFYSYRGEEIRW